MNLRTFVIFAMVGKPGGVGVESDSVLEVIYAKDSNDAQKQALELVEQKFPKNLGWMPFQVIMKDVTTGVPPGMTSGYLHIYLLVAFQQLPEGLNFKTRLLHNVTSSMVPESIEELLHYQMLKYPPANGWKGHDVIVHTKPVVFEFDKPSGPIQ